MLFAFSKSETEKEKVQQEKQTNREEWWGEAQKNWGGGWGHGREEKTQERRRNERKGSGICLCKASRFHCCLPRTDWFSKCEKKKHFKPILNVLHPEFKYHKFE